MIRDCFLEEVAHLEGKKEEIAKSKEISWYRTLETREIHKPGAKQGSVSLEHSFEGGTRSRGRNRIWKSCVQHGKEPRLYPESTEDFMISYWHELGPMSHFVIQLT